MGKHIIMQVIVSMYLTAVQEEDFFIHGHECVHETTSKVTPDIGDVGYITSPNYPEDYGGEDSFCEIEIEPQCRYCRLQISMEEYSPPNCTHHNDDLEKKITSKTKNACYIHNECEYIVVTERKGSRIQQVQWLQSEYQSDYITDNKFSILIHFCYSKKITQNAPWKLIYSLNRTYEKSFDAQDLTSYVFQSVKFISPGYPQLNCSQPFYLYLYRQSKQFYTLSFDDYDFPLSGMIEVYNKTSGRNTNLVEILHADKRPDVVSLSNTTFFVFKPGRGVSSYRNFIGFKAVMKVVHQPVSLLRYGDSADKPIISLCPVLNTVEYGGILNLTRSSPKLSVFNRKEILWFDCIWQFRKFRDLSNYIKLIKMEVSLVDASLQLRRGLYSSAPLLWDFHPHLSIDHQSTKETTMSGFYLRFKGPLKKKDEISVAYTLVRFGYCTSFPRFYEGVRLNFKFGCKGSSMCIPEERKCDGADHCGDGQDEITDCPAVERHPPPCDAFTMSCDGGHRCFTASQRCNGLNDCLDGSDERHCDFDVPTRHPRDGVEVNLLDYWYLVAGFVVIVLITVLCAYRSYKRRTLAANRARPTSDLESGTPLNVFNYDSVRPFSTEPPDPNSTSSPPPSATTAPPPSYDEVVNVPLTESSANNRIYDMEEPPKYEFVADIGRDKVS